MVLMSRSEEKLNKVAKEISENSLISLSFSLSLSRHFICNCYRTCSEQKLFPNFVLMLMWCVSPIAVVNGHSRQPGIMWPFVCFHSATLNPFNPFRHSVMVISWCAIRPVVNTLD